MSTFVLRSSSFSGGARIPRRHTCEGQDISPPLSWSEPPAGTSGLALLVVDPDAPSGTFTHWIAWGFDLGAGGLAEGARAPSEGRNDFGTTGYRGPCPPRRHGSHRYVFMLYAVDAAPALEPGADRAAFERALEGHVLDVAELVGLYER